MAVRPTPKFNPDELHLDLMIAPYGCQDSIDIADALIECIELNDYQTDPVYLVQCLVEIHHPFVVERVKKHFNL